MIIWKGWGILVVLAGIGGLVIGGLLGAALGMGAYVGAAGMLVAALANFGLCKLLYRREARVLVDPRSGQQFLDKPSHSLFFIPAKAWTWIFAALAVPMAIFGAGAKKLEAKLAATPGHAAFQAANKLIDSRGDAVTHGNTPEAKTAAGLFSTMIQEIQKQAFTGGSKRNLMTGGDFLTYCHQGTDAVVFLCHVPELRNYKEQEAKDSLAEIAWVTAKTAALKLDPEKKKQVVVGLRGIANYGFIMSGSHAEEKPPLAAKDSDAEILYPPFADTQATPAPAKTDS